MTDIRRICISAPGEWFDLSDKDWLEINITGEGLITFAARITCTPAVANYFLSSDSPSVSIWPATDKRKQLHICLEKENMDASYKNSELFVLADIAE